MRIVVASLTFGVIGIYWHAEQVDIVLAPESHFRFGVS
jgi:hypothetical protein